MTAHRTIKLADPGVSPADEHAALRVLRSGRLVSGPEAITFETALAGRVGRKHAVATSSGTAALFAAMMSHGVDKDSVVVVPALTFPAPATVAGFLGAEVRACDIDPDTLNLSAKTLEPHLDDKVSLVIAIDQFGNPAPVEELEDLLRPRGIPVLVDAACSMGSSINGRPCGALGETAIYSFHPRKVITTGEGGVVLTDDDHIAELTRSIVNHGQKDGAFSTLGLNLRLSEMAAAIGHTQLSRLDAIVKRRGQLADLYRDGLPLKFQSHLPNAIANNQTLMAILPPGQTSDDRFALIDHLRKNGIEAQIASYCLGAIESLARELKLDKTNTPNSLEVHHRGFALPLHAGLSNDDVTYVVQTVKNWLKDRGVI